MPSRWGAIAKSSNRPARHVQGEQVAAGIGFVAGRRDAHLLHPVDDAVVADVGGEVEFAGGLDEVDVALPLNDGLASLLAAGLGEVAEVLDRVRTGIVAVDLRAGLVGLRTEHVVDLAVAWRAHAVVGVVRQGEPRVERARHEGGGRRG